MDVTDAYEDRSSFLNWYLIASLAGIEVKGKITECPRILTMQLNGIEINSLSAIASLEKNFNDLVEKKALEKLEELKQDLLEPFEEKVQEFTDHLEDLLKVQPKGN